jgi:hypothetical protein
MITAEITAGIGAGKGIWSSAGTLSFLLLRRNVIRFR